MIQPLPPPIVTNPHGMNVVKPRTGTWSSGVFGCWDDTEICCLGFWCAPCLSCKVTKVFGDCLCLSLLNLLAGRCPLIDIAIRSSMRERYCMTEFRLRSGAFYKLELHWSHNGENFHWQPISAH
ncbi:hypothetical protein Q5P01_002231 [Channa striata]|uniref:Uncharacterized protein n=1 Tax=Channa striata TaxID=64152 RepID=A0AA88T5Z3_CHASR|nr:hypothetical protein Q5P01_002231 [Channa striata]